MFWGKGLIYMLKLDLSGGAASKKLNREGVYNFAVGVIF